MIGADWWLWMRTRAGDVLAAGGWDGWQSARPAAHTLLGTGGRVYGRGGGGPLLLGLRRLSRPCCPSPISNQQSNRPRFSPRASSKLTGGKGRLMSGDSVYKWLSWGERRACGYLVCRDCSLPSSSPAGAVFEVGRFCWLMRGWSIPWLAAVVTVRHPSFTFPLLNSTNFPTPNHLTQLISSTSTSPAQSVRSTENFSST
jgi:hypothetical protein